ncbi:MAG: phage tail tape measure protein [Prevotellaceae bacterium]|jgi:hypothetical protein|nr:phage tail tape measure protein [Prevotellaceae bacterium]
MTGDKAVKLAFLLSATDQMSNVLEKAAGGLDGFQKKAAEVGAKAMQIGGHFMTLGNQIGGGMLNIVRTATDYGDSAIKTAQRVGMQVGEWQKLAYAAEFAGVGNEQLASGMAKFDRVLVEASKGTGSAAQAFKNLGINLKDASGKLRAPQDILSDVSNVFAGVKDSAEKSALAQELFGKSGAQLIPLLNSGAEGLKKMGKEAEDMGLALSEEAAKACENFNDNLERVNKATLGLKIQIGTALIPVFENLINIVTGVIKSVTGFAKEHPIITKVISGTVTVIGGLLFGFGALAVTIGAVSYIIAQLTKLTKVYTAIKRVCLFVVGTAQRVFGFLQVAIAGARKATVASNAATRAYIVSQKAGVTTSLAYRTGQALSTAAQWLWNGAVTAGRAIMAFFTSGIILTGIKMGALAVWQGIVTAAQWLFNASLYGCPVVWIIAAIMAVIAAVVLMVKYWDGIVDFFKGIWDGIKNIFSSVWEWIKKMFLNYTPHGLIIKHWEAISAWFGRLWDGVKNVFANAWNGIIAWFSSIPEKFTEFGRNLINGLIAGILSAVTKLWETIKNIGKKIGGFFSKILGINSPSTVFARYGMNITQGLVVGIDRGGDDVEGATGGLAMQAVTGYGQAVQAQTVPAGVAGNMGGSGGSFNYSPTINIGAGVSESTKQDFTKLLRDHYREIVDIIQRATENKTRLSYT